MTDYGPLWVGAVVNAIGQSPYWSSTAIIITWDDWGGWFDHVESIEANPNGYPNNSSPPPNPYDPNELVFACLLL
jgi:phospholipase C